MPLQLFEPRYLDMIAECMKHQSQFVIALIKNGREVDAAVEYYDVGTTVVVQDFDKLPSGMLGITVEGVEKVSISDKARNANGLHVAEAALLQSESFMEMPAVFDDLVALLKRLMLYPAVQRLNMQVDWDDARQVGWRLTELLPIPGWDKQQLLELDNPVSRLQKICEVISLLEG